MLLEHIPAVNPIHRVNEAVRLRLARAQRNTIEQAFQTAAAVCDSVFSDLKIAVASPPDLADQDPRTITDEPLSDLVTRFLALFVSAGIPESHARLHAVNAARRVQLVRGFDEPDSIVEMVTAKAQDIAQAFPRTASDLECGRNPGDVLDPFILTATQTLLYGGDFASAIGATVAHKALMIIEGLIGHLHEDVIGHMRGNVKAPEPRGFNQEIIDLETNPFPGADIVQPPTSANGALRFHQVKSKTGSAKGGDGKRLGDQLRVLAQYYHGEVFYDALTGNTLKGHRSMGAVLTAAPNAVVLVGSAAFKALTGSTHGAELLLRLYQTAFTEAAIRSGYAIDAMTVGIVETFRARAAECGDGLLESILADSTSGQEDDQDSRIFPPAVRRRARTGG